jgi:hypothetical protein
MKMQMQRKNMQIDKIGKVILVPKIAKKYS